MTALDLYLKISEKFIEMQEIEQSKCDFQKTCLSPDYNMVKDNQQIGRLMMMIDVMSAFNNFNPILMEYDNKTT